MPLKAKLGAGVVFRPARGRGEWASLAAEHFVHRHRCPVWHRQFALFVRLYGLLALEYRVLIARVRSAGFRDASESVDGYLDRADLLGVLAVPARHKVYLAQEWVQVCALAHLNEHFELVVGCALCDRALDEVDLGARELSERVLGSDFLVFNDPLYHADLFFLLWGEFWGF